ncbi:MAG TPA: three-Cys-motif partner protein TcmP [Opitutaceae bacterium]|nr:three-Cys-motif partner protein TcmP [Opitutaceae bacterium]
MGKHRFHKEPYDAGTLTKLDIFEAYTQAWIPVFLSQPEPRFTEVHIFDFFCGPGTDSTGAPGSPLRILKQLKIYHASHRLYGWDKVKIYVHLSDADHGKCSALAELIDTPDWKTPGVSVQVNTLLFEEALATHRAILENPRAAKLLIIDQCGVNAVTDAVFHCLTKLPTSDFIFFLSSSTLNRFRDHPSIKVKIDRPEDSYHVHRLAFEHFKDLADADYFLGRFSIKKPKGNIYGLIFGSAHPRGIHKFLEVAWNNDAISGEANFDIDRDNIAADELLLDLPVMRPKKIQEFESDLEATIRSGAINNESTLLRFLMEAGMTSRHSRTILKKLKDEHVIACEFNSPDIRNFYKGTRSITLL